jgi:NADH-quinone oxidoreductase subunit C
VAQIAKRYAMLCDITAVDHGADAPQRFEVVYHFHDLSSQAYLRVGVFCADNTTPSLPSLVGLYPAADWHERETYDLLGIKFEGHPNLTRIMMWEGYPYHPLRKDFPLAGLPTELPDADVAEITGASVETVAMAGGPFTASPGATAAEREPIGHDQSWRDKR